MDIINNNDELTAVLEAYDYLDDLDFYNDSEQEEDELWETE